jgi:hypothetical protein
MPNNLKLPTTDELLEACTLADWEQVRQNGGPPCFYYERERGEFCLRARRWAGHDTDHPYVHLACMVSAAVDRSPESPLEAAARRVADKWDELAKAGDYAFDGGLESDLDALASLVKPPIDKAG